MLATFRLHPHAQTQRWAQRYALQCFLWGHLHIFERHAIKKQLTRSKYFLKFVSIPVFREPRMNDDERRWCRNNICPMWNQEYNNQTAKKTLYPKCIYLYIFSYFWTNFKQNENSFAVVIPTRRNRLEYLICSLFLLGKHMGTFQTSVANTS